MTSTTPGQNMRGIRQTKPNTYVVRVSRNGVQRHLGTFRTLDEARKARDGELSPAPNLRAVQALTQAEAVAAEAKKDKCNGIYVRNTAHGTVYDVMKYSKGHYVWGGRHRTREQAEAARNHLELRPNQAAVSTRGERGITVRFKKGRRGSAAAAADPTPVFVARIFRGGAQHLGTFDTIEDAREAIDAALARPVSAVDVGA